MGVLSALYRSPMQQPGAAGVPQFSQQMAQTGQMQAGMPQAPAASVRPPMAPMDAQLAMLLQQDPFFSLRTAQQVQQSFPQKRPSHRLGSGRS